MAALLSACRQPAAEVHMDSGQAVFLAHCSGCHGEQAEGRPGLYPPLAEAEFVKGPPERLAALILDGIQGPLGGYNGPMPAWRGVLQDAEIAAVMTWLRKAPVTAVEVNHVRLETAMRNTFWTAPDLRNAQFH